VRFGRLENSKSSDRFNGKTKFTNGLEWWQLVAQKQNVAVGGIYRSERGVNDATWAIKELTVGVLRCLEVCSSQRLIGGAISASGRDFVLLRDRKRK
jgi:hypothetical protein